MLTRRKPMLKSVTTPLIAILHIDGGELKMYGPFDNGAAALEWYEKQPKDVRITFRPLRNPDVVRTYNDFYLPIWMENEDREFSVVARSSQ
jgi:hypothetical protein